MTQRLNKVHETIGKKPITSSNLRMNEGTLYCADGSEVLEYLKTTTNDKFTKDCPVVIIPLENYLKFLSIYQMHNNWAS